MVKLDVSDDGDTVTVVVTGCMFRLWMIRWKKPGLMVDFCSKTIPIIKLLYEREIIQFHGGRIKFGGLLFSQRTIGGANWDLRHVVVPLVPLWCLVVPLVLLWCHCASGGSKQPDWLKLSLTKSSQKCTLWYEVWQRFVLSELLIKALSPSERGRVLNHLCQKIKRSDFRLWEQTEWYPLLQRAEIGCRLFPQELESKKRFSLLEKADLVVQLSVW